MLNCIQLETGGRNRLQSVFEMRNEICPISSTLLPIIIPNYEGKCKVAKSFLYEYTTSRLQQTPAETKDYSHHQFYGSKNMVTRML